MTSTETYTAAASQARQATEKSVDTWKQGTLKLADQATSMSKFGKIDLVEPVERYFEYLQRSIDLNRDLATRWAELVTSISGIARDQAEKVSHIVTDQTETVANVITDQARKAEELAQEQAEEAENAEKEQARLARQAERAQAKEAHVKAREPYEDLTKAELSDQLAERGLPRTGNRDEVIDRLVESDTWCRCGVGACGYSCGVELRSVRRKRGEERRNCDDRERVYGRVRGGGVGGGGRTGVPSGAVGAGLRPGAAGGRCRDQYVRLGRDADSGGCQR
jgi:hypothetical protein